MRDEKDPGTLEMQLPKRRGRPPLNGLSAQTAADHSRAYRQRRKSQLRAEVKIADMSDMAIIDALRRAVSEGMHSLVVIYAKEIQERHEVI
ncbi:hypothetical protein [Xanthomonas sp. 3058]|uniref:hypothetical protein n=1 Tax=Xanthomonas sp. 3058 TaxID=3035314 RepID=UPI001610B921|nr:hypothetical protein [Xanthomonas sp. 3058]MBB5865922.1 hypothetical protein [Xanthomonas sp. 3058]